MEYGPPKPIMDGLLPEKPNGLRDLDINDLFMYILICRIIRDEWWSICNCTNM